MSTIKPCDLPPGSLLGRYAGKAYTDGYEVDLPGHVPIARFVEAFYTSRLFKLERLLLGVLVGRRATDEDARQLAAGFVDRFSAWSVEAREADQILLCDFTGRTRSWLMVRPLSGPGAPATCLHFGSAVIPRSVSTGGEPKFDWVFRALLGFHDRYSRALIRSALVRLASVPD